MFLRHISLLLIVATNCFADRLRKTQQPDEYCQWVTMTGASLPYYADAKPKQKPADYWDYWGPQQCFSEATAKKKCWEMGMKCSGIQAQANECNPQYVGNQEWTLRAGRITKVAGGAGGSIKVQLKKCGR
eukprot:gnl/MRDRNA2_/MRDRNA2_94648_c0_seq1.p1 gnl/MRDRNA2_/MRDRNA2_94648_c0~~gnl/MRDRNA2_/MRDRNA2_94648_c0_seq1.p1  ORF type:complete len:130 (-),score=19.07 gnl/MRDRNA2_/MRDRNA2_94648_c0_seq1:59-448(-)